MEPISKLHLHRPSTSSRWLSSLVNEPQRRVSVESRPEVQMGELAGNGKDWSVGTEGSVEDRVFLLRKKSWR